MRVDPEKAAAYGLKPGTFSARRARIWPVSRLAIFTGSRRSTASTSGAAGRAGQRDQRSGDAARHPAGRSGETVRGGRRRGARHAQRHRAGRPLPEDRRAPQRVGTRSRGVAGDVERVLQGINLPLEYNAKVLGEYAERQASQGRLLVASIVAIIGIFFVLQAALGSLRLASSPSSPCHGPRWVACWRCSSRATVYCRSARWSGSDGARHRQSQRHHDDQSLPAPPRRGRGAIWS